MINIGIICPSEIAFRRFMPALQKCNDRFKFVGIAVASKEEWGGAVIPSDEILDREKEKALSFIKEYGGKVFLSYIDLIQSNEIDAIYVPLPPALHYKWGKKVLEYGKHLFMEKPFTIDYENTKELIDLSESKKLVIHENYMFTYHSQIEYVKTMIKNKEFGEIRLIRIDFGFPFRGAHDFRYNKELGGGALIDCGGYTLRLATDLLGNTTRLTSSNLIFSEEFGVDIAGSATLVNSEQLTAQVSFGMDNTYRCSLDIWGSKKSLYTNRILTAPVGYKPEFLFTSKDGSEKLILEDDDTFMKSLIDFYEKIVNSQNESEKILKQASIVQKVLKAH